MQPLSWQRDWMPSALPLIPCHIRQRTADNKIAARTDARAIRYGLCRSGFPLGKSGRQRHRSNMKNKGVYRYGKQ